MAALLLPPMNASSTLVGNPRSRSRVERFIFLLRALSAARMASVDRLVWSRFNLFNVITRGYKSGARPDRIDCME